MGQIPPPFAGAPPHARCYPKGERGEGGWHRNGLSWGGRGLGRHLGWCVSRTRVPAIPTWTSSVVSGCTRPLPSGGGGYGHRLKRCATLYPIPRMLKISNHTLSPDAGSRSRHPSPYVGIGGSITSRNCPGKEHRVAVTTRFGGIVELRGGGSGSTHTLSASRWL